MKNVVGLFCLFGSLCLAEGHQNTPRNRAVDVAARQCLEKVKAKFTSKFAKGKGQPNKAYAKLIASQQQSVVVSANGKLAAIYGENGGSVVDVTSGKKLMPLKAHKAGGKPTEVEFSDDGKKLFRFVSGRGKGAGVYCLDLKSGNETFRAFPKGDGYRSVEWFNPNSQRLIFSDWSEKKGRLYFLWDRKTGAKRALFQGKPKNRWLNIFGYSPKTGAILAETVKIRALDAVIEETKLWRFPYEFDKGLKTFFPKRTTALKLALGGNESLGIRWEGTSPKNIPFFEKFSTRGSTKKSSKRLPRFRQTHLSKDGRYALLSFENGDATLWDLTANQAVTELKFGKRNVDRRQILVSNNSNTVVVASGQANGNTVYSFFDLHAAMPAFPQKISVKQSLAALSKGGLQARMHQAILECVPGKLISTFEKRYLDTAELPLKERKKWETVLNQGIVKNDKAALKKLHSLFAGPQPVPYFVQDWWLKKLQSEYFPYREAAHHFAGQVLKNSNQKQKLAFVSQVLPHLGRMDVEARVRMATLLKGVDVSEVSQSTYLRRVLSLVEVHPSPQATRLREWITNELDVWNRLHPSQ